MYCKKCGNELSEGVKFCTQCGLNIDQGAPLQFDEKEYKKTKRRKNSWFFGPILGLVVIVVIWGIVQVIIKTIGVDPNSLPVILKIFNLLLPIVITLLTYLIPVGIGLGIYYAIKQNKLKKLRVS